MTSQIKKYDSVGEMLEDILNKEQSEEIMKGMGEILRDREKNLKEKLLIMSTALEYIHKKALYQSLKDIASDALYKCNMIGDD